MSEVKHQLQHYIPIAKTIAQMFGHSCEVVIHDLTQPQSSVMFTINNHVTGREIGQSFDHLVKQVLLSDEFDEDYLAGYEIKTEDGRTIKASTTLLRDEKDQVIGALCINYDMSAVSHVKKLIGELIPGLSNEMPAKQRNEDKDSMQSVDEIADRLIDQIISHQKGSLKKRQEKIELIRFMDEKGIFLMKGSVDKVAERLGISKVTVYSYLDELKKMKESEETV
ncbi:DNA-binding protein [Bacillus australimaris]|uniref:DNA-binding protein n=1 Tax=Bacillus australimaris TaxID=1326968 RepID=A0ABD4QL45_9BACI|nr:helix-turn-helix transcriptional regulator [Bacillus australimaris]KPN13172.1 DNA-binding protein [Bacillus australimaris]MBR8691112.1 transcriptional regulator [Bacillus australimaris]